MLVLSRREKEKIKFPTLGITIEVVRTGSNKVQLGIDAPREIRVIREELEEFSDSFPPPLRHAQALQLQQQLDAVSMAVHLARNQLRQGLDSCADEALEQAVSILAELESDFEVINGVDTQDQGYVRETCAHYQAQNADQPLSDIVDNWFRSSFV